MAESTAGRSIAGFFDYIAANYTADEQAVPHLLAAALSDSELAGRKVADLGCGTGVGAVWLAQRAGFVAALDISARSLATGSALRQRYKLANLAFLRADLRRIPLAGERFDLAVCVGALPYLDDEAAALARCLALLKPGGTLVVTLMRRSAGAVLLAALRRGYSLLPLPLARALARLIVTLGRPFFTRLLKREDAGPGGRRKSLEQTFLETFATPLPVRMTTLAAVHRAVTPLGVAVEEILPPDSVVSSSRTVLFLRLRRA